MVFALLASAAFAQEQRQPAYHIWGFVEPSVFPLINGAGEIIQWNASLFSGAVVQGSYKHGICVGAKSCYGFDGRGNWKFNLDGSNFCKDTCTYTATGNLVISAPITMPDGSFIYQLNSMLVGTFVDQFGDTHPNVMGYYNAYTAPTAQGFGGIPVPAEGGITIVLQDN
jgi:hypothetical protein